MIEVTKISPITGRSLTRMMDITQDQWFMWQHGELIQRAMPHLSADDREWLMSGCTPEDWEEMFSGQEEDLYEEADEEASSCAGPDEETEKEIEDWLKERWGD